MTSPQLLDYVRQQVTAGVSKEEIKKSLATQGWNEQDVNEALAAVIPAAPNAMPVPEPKHTATIGREDIIGGGFGTHMSSTKKIKTTNKKRAFAIGSVLFLIYYFGMGFVTYGILFLIPANYALTFSSLDLQLTVYAFEMLIYSIIVFFGAWFYYRRPDIPKTVDNASSLIVIFIACYFLGNILEYLVLAAINYSNFIIKLQWQVVGTLDGLSFQRGYASHYFLSWLVFLAAYILPTALVLLIPRKITAVSIQA